MAVEQHLGDRADVVCDARGAERHRLEHDGGQALAAAVGAQAARHDERRGAGHLLALGRDVADDPALQPPPLRGQQVARRRQIGAVGLLHQALDGDDPRRPHRRVGVGKLSELEAVGHAVKPPPEARAERAQRGDVVVARRDDGGGVAQHAAQRLGPELVVEDVRRGGGHGVRHAGGPGRQPRHGGDARQSGMQVPDAAPPHEPREAQSLQQLARVLVARQLQQAGHGARARSGGLLQQRADGDIGRDLDRRAAQERSAGVGTQPRRRAQREDIDLQARALVGEQPGDARLRERPGDVADPGAAGGAHGVLSLLRRPATPSLRRAPEMRRRHSGPKPHRALRHTSHCAHPAAKSCPAERTIDVLASW